MRGEFEDEFEPPRERRDTELALSATALLAIFFGMVLLCGLFFGLGFAAGRFGPSESQAASQQKPPSNSIPPVAASSRAKPSPISQGNSEPQEAAVETPSPVQAAETSPATNPPSPVPANSQSLSSRPASNAQLQPATPARPVHPAAAPQVRPALPVRATAAQPRAALHAEPDLSQAPTIMVQIAAVSHQQDADVLVNALRKRGYLVSAHRQPSDNMLHVKIGPFASLQQANVMRQKLLSDGYNAIVQP